LSKVNSLVKGSDGKGKNFLKKEKAGLLVQQKESSEKRERKIEFVLGGRRIFTLPFFRSGKGGGKKARKSSIADVLRENRVEKEELQRKRIWKRIRAPNNSLNHQRAKSSVELKKKKEM